MEIWRFHKKGVKRNEMKELQVKHKTHLGWEEKYDVSQISILISRMWFDSHDSVAGTAPVTSFWHASVQNQTNKYISYFFSYITVRPLDGKAASVINMSEYSID